MAPVGVESLLRRRLEGSVREDALGRLQRVDPEKSGTHRSAPHCGRIARRHHQIAKPFEQVPVRGFPSAWSLSFTRKMLSIEQTEMAAK